MIEVSLGENQLLASIFYWLQSRWLMVWVEHLINIMHAGYVYYIGIRRNSQLHGLPLEELSSILELRSSICCSLSFFLWEKSPTRLSVLSDSLSKNALGAPFFQKMQKKYEILQQNLSTFSRILPPITNWNVPLVLARKFKNNVLFAFSSRKKIKLYPFRFWREDSNYISLCSLFTD